MTINHEYIHSHHIFTSPDLPELLVVHRSYEVAQKDIAPSIKIIEELKHDHQSNR